MDWPADLDERIALSMRWDQHRLTRSWKTVQQLRSQQKPFDQPLAKLLQDVDKSTRMREQRAGDVPQLEYDAELPITAKREELLAAIRDHQVIIVCGETGSGKSTQLPKICLEAGRGVTGIIGHTQPRRIAARSVAARLAEELKIKLGSQVGYKIRFNDVSSPRTLIKLMTDGILLAETQNDRYLDRYDTIIIDEAHERSLNIDFLMGYLRRILPKRPDLRVIITSATIDAQRFAEFFAASDTVTLAPSQPSSAPPQLASVPVLEVSGRSYPVEVRYRPPEHDVDDDEVDWSQSIGDAIDELAREGTGDILVFLPTEQEIREIAKTLGGRGRKGEMLEVLPLYGRLSEAEQNRIFAPSRNRKVVLATNVAESSLTVPGIHYVIDTGTARISRYAPQSKVQRLPIEPISRASADQRKGRCGRIAPGICIRLYSADDFQQREAYTSPEILRTNLASVILQTKSLALGDLADFPLLDPPSPAAIRSGERSLFELGALDEEGKLTPVGRTLSKWPIDPGVARMILAADDEQCLEEVLIIASALEIRDPRERPVDKQFAADSAHQKFADERSDFMSFLKLWDFAQEQEEKLSRGQFQKMCRQNFLSALRLREWTDLTRQLKQIAEEHGLKPKHRKNQPDSIHRAVLSGLLSNIALKGEKNDYTGAGNQILNIWPGSVLFKTKPRWFVAAELVETTKRYARVIAPVDPMWIERQAVHLIKKTYSDAAWEARL